MKLTAVGKDTWALPRANVGMRTFPPAAMQLWTYNSCPKITIHWQGPDSPHSIYPKIKIKDFNFALRQPPLIILKNVKIGNTDFMA